MTDTVEPVFVARRPPWVKDEDVTVCLDCGLPFSLFRRKHHCRQCGNVFCDACTSKKMPLPYLGYTEEMRVCMQCVHLSYLLSCCTSNTMSVRRHGAAGLADATFDDRNYGLLIHTPSLETLVALVRSDDEELQLHGTGGLANLARSALMHDALFSAGAVDVLVMLGSSRGGSRDVLLNVAGAFSNFVRIEMNRVFLVDSKCLEPLALLSKHPDKEIQTLSLKALSCFAATENLRSSIIRAGDCLQAILALVTGGTQEVRKSVAKILAYLSLVEGDSDKEIMVARGTFDCLVQLAQSGKRGIVAHAACAIANLASAPNNQAQLGELMGVELLFNLCRMDFGGKGGDVEVQRHSTRAFANLASSPVVQLAMVEHGDLIRELVRIAGLGNFIHPDIRRNAVRALANLTTTDSVRMMLRGTSLPRSLRPLINCDDTELAMCASFILNRLEGKQPHQQSALATEIPVSRSTSSPVSVLRTNISSQSSVATEGEAGSPHLHGAIPFSMFTNPGTILEPGDIVREGDDISLISTSNGPPAAASQVLEPTVPSSTLTKSEIIAEAKEDSAAKVEPPKLEPLKALNTGVRVWSGAAKRKMEAQKPPPAAELPPLPFAEGITPADPAANEEEGEAAAAAAVVTTP